MNRPKLTLELTGDQRDAIRAFWSKHGMKQGAMLCQPKLRGDDYSLVVAILDEAETERVFNIIER